MVMKGLQERLEDLNHMEQRERVFASRFLYGNIDNTKISEESRKRRCEALERKYLPFYVQLTNLLMEGFMGYSKPGTQLYKSILEYLSKPNIISKKVYQ